MTDRDDLLGLLAVRNNLLAPEALDALLQECGRDDTPLGQLLLGRGLLRQNELECLEGLAEGQVRRHGNDAARTLATLRTAGEARAPSGPAQQAPADVPATRAAVSPPAAEAHDPFLTRTTAEGPAGAAED